METEPWTRELPRMLLTLEGNEPILLSQIPSKLLVTPFLPFPYCPPAHSPTTVWTSGWGSKDQGLGSTGEGRGKAVVVGCQGTSSFPQSRSNRSSGKEGTVSCGGGRGGFMYTGRYEADLWTAGSRGGPPW